MVDNSISVIIPVFNAQNFLMDLFECLDRNQFLPGDEILLVDNGSTDRSYEMCKKKADENPQLYRVITYTKKAGSYAARNYAVNNAKGNILVFTDSDTKPSDNWIETLRYRVKKGIIVAGRICLDIVNDGIWEKFDTIAHLNSEQNAKENQIATANMGVKREDFYKVGMFEERFSGGDYEWSRRAGELGVRIVFDANAVVHHPTRKTFEQILKKEERIAYGAGNHYRNKEKSYGILIIKYVLKIFKIDTNIQYSAKLRKMGCTYKEVRIFNCKFMMIRFQQLVYAIKGYKMIDPRKIGIK